MPSFEQRFVRPSSTTLSRLLTLLFASISLILFSISLSFYRSYISPYDQTQRWNGGGNHSDIIALVAIANCILWLVCSLHRSLFTSNPLHPGWSVSMDLLCFLVLLGTLSFGMLSNGMTSGSNMTGGQKERTKSLCAGKTPFPEHGDYKRPEGGEPANPRCEDAVRTMKKLDAAGYTFGWVVCVLFLTFFVKSCVDCYRFNRSRGIREIKYEIRLDNGIRPTNSREHFVTIPNANGWGGSEDSMEISSPPPAVQTREMV